MTINSPFMQQKKLCADLFAALKALSFDGVGITRLAYTVTENAAFDLVETKAKELGLAAERDAAGSLIVTLAGTDPSLPFIASGSHLDSVRQGGNHDGAAGVVAALGVLAALKQEGFTPKRGIKLFALRGEESARFGKAYMGSLSLLGKLTASDLAVKDSAGMTMVEAMREVKGIDTARIEKGAVLMDLKTMGVWLELHIEQGPVLIAKKLPVGIVTGIRGNFRHRTITCTGEAGHSGAVPGELRHDALFASADLVMRMDRHWKDWLAKGKDLVLTFGVFGTDPQEHAIARIPGAVSFSLDIRSQNQETLNEFYALFQAECRNVEHDRGVVFSFDRRVDSTTAVMDPAWTARLKKAARSLGLTDQDIPSGAGHDAAVFAAAGVPAAMVFVRNEGGSHNPKEAMDIEDFMAGVAVLGTAVKEAANE